MKMAYTISMDSMTILLINLETLLNLEVHVVILGVHLETKQIRMCMSTHFKILPTEVVFKYLNMAFYFGVVHHLFLCFLKLVTDMDHQYMFRMESFHYLRFPILHPKFKIKLKPYRAGQFLSRTIVNLLVMFMVKIITKEVVVITQ
jgi:hypothetical protein